MCCCDKPTVNGEFGYKWQPNDAPMVRRPNAPELHEGQSLIHDEPGRCGGLDSHCHHYRVVKWYSSVYLLVRHGGGDECFRLCTTKALLDTLAALDSSPRYWMLNSLYHAYGDGKRIGTDQTNNYWRTAAADGRIKTRKLRGRNAVKVSVEPKAMPLES
ncbi:hypothetical protein [Edaphobacter dinghuensis]|uniref:Uncharacterized protein n=1 Tax=Edaphobacter dinghuensis TaxID=1560005 RepID=A0A917MBE8_9BACT|nr:hypothetical protein [Edaphobacter dinghuensis]GGG87103.1 hypothetical protein GCM10011585_33900 [Edaphobacter dinghuensis]